MSSPHTILNVPEEGVMDQYKAQLLARGYQSDAAQLKAIERLQTLYSELLEFKAVRRSTLRKWLFHPDLPQSVYLWGGVGRGKSFMMDCFYDALPYERKRRIHFHAFMQSVHAQLNAFNTQDNPLLKVADQIAEETRLLCFDEFHISDIATAMILGRLLEALMSRGVVLVMTSNYAPADLYPNGLQRENFLPAIAFIEENFDVLEVDDGTDYRLQSLSRVNRYLTPCDAQTHAELETLFHELCADNVEEAGDFVLFDRPIPVRRRAQGVVWFDFSALCEGPRSQNDYLEIARNFETVLLSNVPAMNASQANEARRFTWLVDVLYDAKVKLIIGAQVPAEQLYVEGVNAQEFTRTVSRLIEMRSQAYLEEPYRPL